MKHTFKILLLTVLLSGAALSATAYEKRDLLQHASGREKIGTELLSPTRWVPYPAYSDRAGWDSLMGEYKDDFIRAGERRLDYVWQVVPATAYLDFKRTGDRGVMQTPNGQNSGALKDLLLAELAEGKGRFIDAIIDGVWQSCEMTSWALSAHLGVQKSHSPLPDYDEHIIDLGSGERAALLSWTYYFLHGEFDKVTPQISCRMRYELKRRIIEPYLYHDYWWSGLHLKQPGSRGLNNWNPWCNYNVLLTYLLMEQRSDTLAQGVWTTMQSVDEYLNYIKGDGGCEEGPAYWGHAAGKLYDYLELLSDATEGKINLFDKPLIKSVGEYIARSYVGNGWVVNFADASARGGGLCELIFRYGKAVNSPLLTGYAAYLRDRRYKSHDEAFRSIAGNDVSRTLRSLLHRKEMEACKGSLTQAPYTWYPETEFCYMTSKKGLFLACKGGYNQESHNHNDVGSFILYAHQTPLFIDAGVGTYTRQTFSSERYKIWSMQSDYHNLPRINGFSEQYGQKYKARNTHFDAGKRMFTTDIAGAYPDKAGVKQWTRSYRLNGNKVTICDDFLVPNAATPHVVNFLTRGEVDTTRPGRVNLEADGHHATLLYDAATFTVKTDTIRQTDRPLQRVWGDEIYRLSLQARSPAAKGRYVFSIEVTD